MKYTQRNFSLTTQIARGESCLVTSIQNAKPACTQRHFRG
nr:MAG TPA: hypothetical protein [Caudoviricetes sp.]